MDLTSLRRVKYALGITKADEDPILAALVGSASRQIVYWLRRTDQSGGNGLELKSRTEYLDPIDGVRAIYPLAYPIASISSLYGDTTGKYAGNEVAVSANDYIISSDSRYLVLTIAPTVPDWYTQMPVVPRGARLIYTAGLAADPVLSVWTKSTDTGGNLTVGYFVLGETSGSVAYITAAGATSLTLECLSGKFLEGEMVTEYKRLDGAATDGGPKDATGVTATLTTCTSRSLAEAHPALVTACEMHISFAKKNRNNFDNLTVSQDGVTRVSRADLKNQYDFMPEIKAFLSPYRNNLVRP